ncbi:GrpB family protein [Dyadobacter sp. CY327]|uniref:GrpB family protein n=1 Tax=Dyadobacter sp. CY327 TaxID=2907301 RepID=UPI00210679A5|nr:GrpB family protein [Dyadobacter sp. CY327]
MPYRRFFVRSGNGFIIPSHRKISKHDTNISATAHIHMLEYGSDHWTRHIAFKEYLGHNEIERCRYEKFKLELSCREWNDSQEYSAAKGVLIAEIEQKALIWYADYND